MRPEGDDDYECKNVGCLDDGFYYNAEAEVTICEYCHTNDKSRFSKQQIIRRLQGTKYSEHFKMFMEPETK